MMGGTLCSVAVLGGVITVAWADPVILGPVQMDAVTAAGGNAYGIAQADATGLNAFTNTNAGAIALDGLLGRLPGFGGGGRAAAMAAAIGPSAQIQVSIKAGYGTAGEVTGQGVAQGSPAFAAMSAGVLTVNGQDYLVGSLAASAAPGLAFVTAPIAMSTLPGMVWSPPAMGPAANAPAIAVASTEVPGGELVTYTLAADDQNGHSTKLSLEFLKPPRSIIPPLFPVGLSGVVPVTATTLQATPVAM